jgi:hypothetical protein
MSAAEYQDAGRLSRKRLTGLLPFGWSLKSPSAKGQLSITGAGSLLGKPFRHPRRAGAWHPLWCSASRERHAQQPGQPLISVVAGLRPVDHKWRSPRGASSLPVALTLIRRESPKPFQNCSRGSVLRNGLSRHKAVRVVAALPTHFLFHDPLLRPAPRLHFFHGMGDSQGSRLK